MYYTIYENVKKSTGYNTLSSNQKEIHNFILSNMNELEDFTINDVANACFCSKTSVNRYCKKMDASGFIELKNSLFYYSSRKAKTNEQVHQSLRASVDELNIQDIELFCNELMKHKIIYIFGTGTSFIMAQYLQRLLNRLGIAAVASNEAHFINNLNQVDACIMISTTGETYVSLQVADKLSNRATVMSITRKNSRMDKISDISLTHNRGIEVNDSLENELCLNIPIMIVHLIDKLSEKIDHS